MKEGVSKTLALMRKQVEQAIKRDYKTVEEFCWDNDISKATVSNFLNSKKDFQVSTLVKIADALDMELTIRLK